MVAQIYRPSPPNTLQLPGDTMLVSPGFFHMIFPAASFLIVLVLCGCNRRAQQKIMWSVGSPPSNGGTPS